MWLLKKRRCRKDLVNDELRILSYPPDKEDELLHLNPKTLNPLDPKPLNPLSPLNPKTLNPLNPPKPPKP